MNIKLFSHSGCIIKKISDSIEAKE